MSGVRAAATVLWTQLVEAIRADGVDIMTGSCGPAVAAIIVDTVQSIMVTTPAHPWLSAKITPADLRSKLGKRHVDGEAPVYFICRYIDSRWIDDSGYDCSPTEWMPIP